MAKLFLQGCGTALVTPFKDGAVDYDAYASLIDRQVAAGVDFLVPLATTGETPTLSREEKVALMNITREHAKGLPLVVGCGTNSFTGTIDNIRLLENLGVDAFLVVVPYYNKPTQEGQYSYFKAVAAQTDKPIVIYNVPGRTGANMSADTCIRLANDCPNIIATKEASGNYSQINEIIRRAPEGFSVLSGDDELTLPIIASGGHGVISVASNIAPKQVAELCAALLRSDMESARKLHHSLCPLFKNCFVESNPIPAKSAMARLGLLRNELRLPLVSSSEKTDAIMDQTLRDLGLL